MDASPIAPATPPAPGLPTGLGDMLWHALEQAHSLFIMVELTPSGTLLIRAVNQAVTQATQFSSAELVGTELGHLSADAEDSTAIASLVAATRAQRVDKVNFHCQTRHSQTLGQGQAIWLRLQVLPTGFPGPSGLPRAIILGRDITQSRQEEDQQRAVQGLLAKVFVTVESAVVLISAGGRIVMTNPAVDKLLARPAG